MTTIATQEAATSGLPPYLRLLALRAALAIPLIALGDFLWRGPSGSSLLLLVFALSAAGCGARAPPGRSFGSAQDAVASKANAASDAAKRRETIMARRLPGRRLQFGESRARGVRVRSGPVRGVR